MKYLKRAKITKGMSDLDIVKQLLENNKYFSSLVCCPQEIEDRNGYLRKDADDFLYYGHTHDCYLRDHNIKTELIYHGYYNGWELDFRRLDDIISVLKMMVRLKERFILNDNELEMMLRYVVEYNLEKKPTGSVRIGNYLGHDYLTTIEELKDFGKKGIIQNYILCSETQELTNELFYPLSRFSITQRLHRLIKEVHGVVVTNDDINTGIIKGLSLIVNDDYPYVLDKDREEDTKKMLNNRYGLYEEFKMNLNDWEYIS